MKCMLFVILKPTILILYLKEEQYVSSELTKLRIASKMSRSNHKDIYIANLILYVCGCAQHTFNNRTGTQSRVSVTSSREVCQGRAV